jgi:hypothetical protein
MRLRGYDVSRVQTEKCGRMRTVNPSTRLPALALVAAALAGVVSACSIHIGSEATASQPEVESMLLQFDAPGDGWQQTDATDTGVDTSSLGSTDSSTLLDNGLWRDGDETATHFVAKATSKNADRVCDEAAGWVSGARDLLPGNTVGRSEEWMAHACRRALGRAAPGAATADHIQGVGGTDDGVQYGAGMLVRTGGVHADVEVTALARPAP